MSQTIRPWFMIIFIYLFLVPWNATYPCGRAVIIYYVIVLFCTKPTSLTARAWPFSIDFNDNNFRCGAKKCIRAGDGKLLYYKSWPKLSLMMTINRLNFKGNNCKRFLSTSGPLHCPLILELPSCLHSPSPSSSLPHTTHGSLCLLAGPGALLWLQLFRCADADPVWDRWSLLPHVDLTSSNSCTEVSNWHVNWKL